MHWLSPRYLKQMLAGLSWENIRLATTSDLTLDCVMKYRPVRSTTASFDLIDPLGAFHGHTRTKTNRPGRSEFIKEKLPSFDVSRTLRGRIPVEHVYQFARASPSNVPHHDHKSCSCEHSNPLDCLLNFYRGCLEHVFDHLRRNSYDCCRTIREFFPDSVSRQGNNAAKNPRIQPFLVAVQRVRKTITNCRT